MPEIAVKTSTTTVELWHVEYCNDNKDWSVCAEGFRNWEAAQIVLHKEAAARVTFRPPYDWRLVLVTTTETTTTTSKTTNVAVPREPWPTSASSQPELK